jgi:hypothetical protein
MILSVILLLWFYIKSMVFIDFFLKSKNGSLHLHCLLRRHELKYAIHRYQKFIFNANASCPRGHVLLLLIPAFRALYHCQLHR